MGPLAADADVHGRLLLHAERIAAANPSVKLKSRCLTSEPVTTGLMASPTCGVSPKSKERIEKENRAV